MPVGWTPLNYNSMFQPIGPNQFEGRFHAGHQFYKDGNGDFQDVDYALVDQGTYWELTKASYNLIIRKDFSDPTLIEFSNKYKGSNHTITYEPHSIQWVNRDDKSQRQTFRTPQVVTGVYDSVGNKIVWTNAFGAGVDFEVVIQRSGIRKWIVAKSAPPAGPFANNLLAPVFKWTGTGVKVKPVGGADWDETTYLEADEFTIEEIGNRNLKSFIKRAVAVDSSDPVKSRQLKVFFDKIGGALYQAKLIPEDLLQQATYPVRADIVQSFYAGAGDGFVENQDSTWSAARTATTGDSVDYTSASPVITCGSRIYTPGTLYGFWRNFYPIDTSGLTSEATISAAALNLWMDGTHDDIDDAYDYWMVVGPTTQASTSSLVVEDFDTCGSVDSPNQWSAQQDANTWTTGAYHSISLNAAGLAGIDKSGISKFGLREGHDIENQDNGDVTFVCRFSTFTYFSEETGTTKDPYLSVTFTLPDRNVQFDSVDPSFHGWRQGVRIVTP